MANPVPSSPLLPPVMDILGIGAFWLIFSVVFFFISPKMLDRAHKRQIAKVVEVNKVGIFFASQVVTLEDEGLRVVTSTEEVRRETWCKYSAVTQFMRSEQHYYLMMLNALILQIPLEAFADGAVQGEFEQAITQRSGQQLQMWKMRKTKGK